LSGDGWNLAVLVRGQEENMLGEASAGSEQAVEVAGLLKLIESSEGNEDALAHAPLVAGVFDNLEVLAWTGLFDAEEHGGLQNKDTTIIRATISKSSSPDAEIPLKRGTTFWTPVGVNPQKTRGFCPSGLENHAATVEDESRAAR
jgi:hypothetical protein